MFKQYLINKDIYETSSHSSEFCKGMLNRVASAMPSAKGRQLIGETYDMISGIASKVKADVITQIDKKVESISSERKNRDESFIESLDVIARNHGPTDDSKVRGAANQLAKYIEASDRSEFQGKVIDVVQAAKAQKVLAAKQEAEERADKTDVTVDPVAKDRFAETKSDQVWSSANGELQSLESLVGRPVAKKAGRLAMRLVGAKQSANVNMQSPESKASGYISQAVVALQREFGVLYGPYTVSPEEIYEAFPELETVVDRQGQVHSEIAAKLVEGLNGIVVNELAQEVMATNYPLAEVRRVYGVSRGKGDSLGETRNKLVKQFHPDRGGTHDQVVYAQELLAAEAEIKAS
jgi:hypothetical protein